MNAKRTSYDYRVNDQVFKKCHEWSKLGKCWDGPYAIKRVHVNGYVTGQLRVGVTERLNIRRFKPHHKPTVQPPANPVVTVQPVGHRTRARS